MGIDGLPLAIVSADWHIKPGLRIWRYKTEPKGDILFAITQILNLCRKYDVPLLLLGDILDSAINTSDCIEILVNYLMEIPIFFVQGQHDKSSPAWLSVRRNSFHTHNRILRLGNFVFTGCDFVLDSAIFKDLPRGNVLLTHQVWKESPIGVGFSIAEVPDCFKYIISGDYHLPFKSCFGERILVYPGVPVPTHIDEFLSPSVLLLYQQEDSLQFDYIRLKSRPYFEHRFVDSASFSKFLSELNLPNDLPESIRKPVIRLFIRESDLSLVRPLLSEFDAYFYISKLEEGKPSKSETSYSNTTDLNGLVYSLCEEKCPGCGNMALKILDASIEGEGCLSDVPRTLRKIFEERVLL